jgi:hypothetical protein
MRSIPTKTDRTLLPTATTTDIPHTVVDKGGVGVSKEGAELGKLVTLLLAEATQVSNDTPFVGNSACCLSKKQTELYVANWRLFQMQLTPGLLGQAVFSI